MRKDVTVLISSSPIASHPSTAIIEETIASVRYHLPDSTIFIMLDGIRKEQIHYTNHYVEYIHNLVAHGLLKERNVMLLPFMEFTHQAWMTVRALELVETPMILFVEHDTPLVDRPIDWKMLKEAILSGETNHIRLHYDESIHQDHQHMMYGKLTQNLIKTIQWHQRPHLARAKWYEKVLKSVFTENSKTFIEDRVYSFVSSAPWESYRLTVYDPEGTGENMKRSRDLNGRGEEQKYPMVF